MAETIWEAGKLNMVWQQVGTRTGTTERRFRRANFDVLQWSSVAGNAADFYVVPRWLGGVTPEEINLKGDIDASATGTEFGYYDLNDVIVEPFEGDGRSDTWKALHSFGYL